MSHYYRLDEQHVPHPCSAAEADHALAGITARRVAETVLNERRASTVFLVVDHQFSPDGPPLLFETMVFSTTPGDNPQDDLYCARYSTWAEAEAGHQAVVEKVRAGLPLD